MKSVLILLSLVLFCLPSNSQITVIANGNVGVGSDATDPDGLFCVGTNGSTYAISYLYEPTVNASGYRTLQVNKKTDGATAGTHLYGIMGYADQGSGGYKMYGVYGRAYRGSTPTNARSYGVTGLAGNGLGGYNYGVYGGLEGSRNGAAIYGTDSYTDVGVNGKYAGYFEGDVHITGDLTVSGSYPGSDIRLKKDVRNLDDDVISKLSHLQAIKYKLKHPSEIEGAQLSDTADMKKIANELHSDKYTRDRIGLIAQELQNTFPEVIKTDNDGFMWVNYDGLVPVLVEAIKEQQNMIDELNDKIDQLMGGSNNLKSGVIASTPDLNIKPGSSVLFQNNPNPFNTDTEIKLYIDNDVKTSIFYIYDLQGKQLRAYKFSERGNTSIIIKGYEFDPGIYLYTLIVDGKEVGTKKMILTE